MIQRKTQKKLTLKEDVSFTFVEKQSMLYDMNNPKERTTMSGIKEIR